MVKIFIRKNFLKQEKGFTLTELLVVLAIFITITMIIYLSFALGHKAYKEAQDSAEITQNGRVVMERISRELRQSKRMISDLPFERESAIDEIFFEDGHSGESYFYIRYFKEGAQAKREAVGYYFSSEPEVFQPWDAVPPEGQTLEEKILDPPTTIGEWVEKMEFWQNDGITNIALVLNKRDKIFSLETRIFSRNF